MKIGVLGMVLAATLSSIASPNVNLGRLPDWAFADTEVSTNCPFRVNGDSMRHFTFSISLVPSVSNNVEIAFGKDADHDGVLSLGEIALTAGWDEGAWFVDSSAGRRTAAPVSVVGESVSAVRLDWDLFVSAGEVKVLSVRENGVSVDFGFGSAERQSLYDGTWDLLRLTARGVEHHDEGCRASITRIGTCIRLK